MYARLMCALVLAAIIVQLFRVQGVDPLDNDVDSSVEEVPKDGDKEASINSIFSDLSSPESPLTDSENTASRENAGQATDPVEEPDYESESTNEVSAADNAEAGQTSEDTGSQEAQDTRAHSESQYEDPWLAEATETSPIECPFPGYIPDGSVEMTIPGLRARYRCEESYTLIGNPELICENGSWNSPPPLCFGNLCEPLEPLYHGTLYYIHSGSIVVTVCEPGYVLKGAPILACDGQNWNGTQSDCVDPAEAEKSDVNGNASKVTDTHLEYLAKADYTCITMDHFVAPPRIVNTVSSAKWALMDGTPRLYAAYRCKWGFVPIKKSKSLYCYHETWIGDQPECHVIEYEKSGDAEKERNSLMINSLSHEEALKMADYSCVGQSSVTNPPEIARGQVTLHVFLSGEFTHLFGEVSCRPGNVLRGRKYIYCKNYAWYGNIPKCVETRF